MIGGRHAAAALCSLALSILTSDAVADEPAQSPRLPSRSEYRLYAGVRHPGELFTANSLTLHRLALRSIDAVTESIEGRRTTSAGATALRAGTFVAIDLPLLTYAIVIPHEYFGHGSRYREFGAKPEVHLDIPLPYSFRPDYFVTHRLTRAFYGGEQSVGALGGLQAEEASQRMLVATTFQSGVLRRGEALLYTATSLTHVGQTLGGGDFREASTLSQRLYRGDPSAYRATGRGALALDLLDPMLAYSLYASAYRYLVRGDRATTAPSLQIGSMRFLATSRTLPVPWGVEHQLHILAASSSLTPGPSFDLGVRTGVGAKESFGVELSTFGWRLLRVMRVGAEAALWFQPEVSSVAALGRPHTFTIFGTLLDVRDERTSGGAARILFEVDQPFWFFGTRLGYKSLGLWGERELAAGFEVALTGGVKLD